MLRWIRKQFGSDVAREYNEVHEGLLKSFIAIRDYFAENNLFIYAKFIQSELIPKLQENDCKAVLDLLESFDKKYNSFQYYQILIREEVERLYRIQRQMDKL